MKSSTSTKPIYADMIAAATRPVPDEEKYDRSTRKDFWNDPERWDGIDDPRETMIWNVRRPDRIDVQTAPAPPPDPLMNASPQQLNQLALMQQQEMQRIAFNQYRQQPGVYDLFGFRLGRY